MVKAVVLFLVVMAAIGLIGNAVSGGWLKQALLRKVGLGGKNPWGRG